MELKKLASYPEVPRGTFNFPKEGKMYQCNLCGSYSDTPGVCQESVKIYECPHCWHSWESAKDVRLVHGEFCPSCQERLESASYSYTGRQCGGALEQVK